MHTYKGIICEINQNYMIFLTAEGEFLRGLPMVTNVDIGDEVEFRLLTTTSSLSKKKKKRLIIGPVLVAAALLIFFFTALLPNTNRAFAYVQVGNELELAVDEEGKVISVTSLNKEKPIEIEEFNGLPLEEALTKAVVEMSPDDKELSITTKYNNEEHSKAKENIENTIQTVQNEKPAKSNNSKQNNDKNNNNSMNSTPDKENNGSTKNNNGNKENNTSEKENNSLNKTDKNKQVEKNQSNSNNSKQNQKENNSSNKENGNNKNTNSSNNENKKNNNGNTGN